MKRSDPAAVRAWRKRGAMAYAAKRRARLRNQQAAEQARATKGRQKAARRRAGLPRINRERRARRFARAYHSVGFCQWVASLACVVPGCDAPHCDVAHVRSRGAGGTWQEVVPCCRVHHNLWHSIGTRAFQARLPEPLESIASAVAQRWMAYILSETSAT